MSKTVWIPNGIFPSYIGFCPTEKAWKKSMKEMSVLNEPYPTSDGKCTEFQAKGKHCIIVTVGDAKGFSEEAIIGLIVHECVHVAQALFRNMGEDIPSSEFEAYTVQHVFMHLFDAYAKTRYKS